MIIMMIATKIKNDLARLGWTVEELARRSGLNLITVQRIILGTVSKPRRGTWDQIEKALNGQSIGSPASGIDGLPVVISWFKTVKREDRSSVIAALDAMAKITASEMVESK